MMNIIDLIGRILLSILFLLNGFLKINNYENTVEWMEGFGMSGLFIIPAIIIEILGSILIIVGYKTKFAAAFLSLFCLMSQAQKFAYVDSDYILERVPEYQSAQEQLDKMTLSWQENIEQL